MADGERHSLFLAALTTFFSSSRLVFVISSAPIIALSSFLVFFFLLHLLRVLGCLFSAFILQYSALICLSRLCTCLTEADLSCLSLSPQTTKGALHARRVKLPIATRQGVNLLSSFSIVALLSPQSLNSLIHWAISRRAALHGWSASGVQFVMHLSTTFATDTCSAFASLLSPLFFIHRLLN